MENKNNDIPLDCKPDNKKRKVEEEGEQKKDLKDDFCFSAEPTLENIRQMQSKFADDRNWNQFHTPRNLLLALVGEVGELAEVFQWKGEVSAGLPDWNDKERSNLGQELSDIVMNAIRLADVCKIDLPNEISKKFKVNEINYPVEKCLKNAMRNKPTKHSN